MKIFLRKHLALADYVISIYFLLELKKIDMRLKKKTKFYKVSLTISSATILLKALVYKRFFNQGLTFTLLFLFV